MNTTHKLDVAAYAAGWVEGELEAQAQAALATKDGARIEAANMNLTQFRVVNTTLDEVIELLFVAERKLAALESTLRS